MHVHRPSVGLAASRVCMLDIGGGGHTWRTALVSMEEEHLDTALAESRRHALTREREKTNYLASSDPHRKCRRLMLVVVLVVVVVCAVRGRWAILWVIILLGPVKITCHAKGVWLKMACVVWWWW